MEDAGQRLAFEKIVSPKGRRGTFGGNNPTAKKGDAGRARFDSGPGPLAHPESPVATRDWFAVCDLEARAGGAGRADSNSLRGWHGSRGEAVAVFANQFAGQHREAR